MLFSQHSLDPWPAAINRFSNPKSTIFSLQIVCPTDHLSLVKDNCLSSPHYWAVDSSDIILMIYPYVSVFRDSHWSLSGTTWWFDDHIFVHIPNLLFSFFLSQGHLSCSTGPRDFRSNSFNDDDSFGSLTSFPAGCSNCRWSTNYPYSNRILQRFKLILKSNSYRMSMPIITLSSIQCSF